MVYRGQVCGAVIVLPPGVRLPDGMEVLVEPIDSTSSEVQPTGLTLRNGVPVFPRNGGGPAPNLKVVNDLRDEVL